MTMLQARGALLTGLGVGVGLMYFFDPDRGRRRRALVRDRLAHSRRIGVDALGVARRDAAHRTIGALSRLRGGFGRRGVDDAVLVDRLRARLGRLVGHARTIEVGARDGVVTVYGAILRAEVPRVLAGLARVRGVKRVVNALEVHDTADHVPALQGGPTSRATRSASAQRRWPPATRLLAGSFATALAGYATSRLVSRG